MIGQPETPWSNGLPETIASAFISLQNEGRCSPDISRQSPNPASPIVQHYTRVNSVTPLHITGINTDLLLLIAWSFIAPCLSRLKSSSLARSFISSSSALQPLADYSYIHGLGFQAIDWMLGNFYAISLMLWYERTLVVEMTAIVNNKSGKCCRKRVIFGVFNQLNDSIAYVFTPYRHQLYYIRQLYLNCR